MLASLVRNRSEQLEPDVLVMGVLNVTPDSFSDGGKFLREEDAQEGIVRLLEQGADIIDIGGESSRPGAPAVSSEEQIRRTDKAIRFAVAQGAVVSIDTTSPAVAAHALSLGARMVNDVSCARDGDGLARICAAANAWYVLMHAREPMETMRGFSVYPEDAYDDVVTDVALDLQMATERITAAGVATERVLWDPGLGFSKNASQSSELLRRLDELDRYGYPLVLGASRKSFLSADVVTPPGERLAASAVAAVAAVVHGARVLRVHDVQQTRQALAVAERVGLLSRLNPARVSHVEATR